MTQTWFDASKRYQLGVGHVQSGKTNIMLDYCKWSIQKQKKSVLFILKNSKPDLEQLTERIRIYNKQTGDPPLNSINVRKARVFGLPRIYMALGNSSQLKKFRELNPTTFHICIDEADLCVKSNNNFAKMEKEMAILKKASSHILGMTATCLALLYHETNLETVKLIKPPDNYYGRERIEKVELGMSLNTQYDNFLKSDQGLLLHVEETKKINQLEMSLDYSRLYPQIMFCVYNGDGVHIRQHVQRKELLQRLHIRDNNPNSIIRIKNHTIRDVIQAIKETKVKHASIISKNLANRGISFVSTDFSYHLTHQILVPTKTIHDESLVQSLRILGVYNKPCQLKLYTSRSAIERIDSLYRATIKYTNGIANSKKVKQIFTRGVNPKKFSRPGCTKGLNWKKDDYGRIAFDDKTLIGDMTEVEDEPWWELIN